MWFDKVKALISQVDGQVGLVVKNLRTAETFSYNPDMKFPSASTIKVYILQALMDEAAAGRIDINKPAPVSTGFVGGSGVIQYLSEMLPLTLRDYAVLMIICSDNAATNKLISTLGIENINTKTQELGTKNTILSRIMMDFEARKQSKDNYTSCADLLTVFTHFYNNSEKYADALTILKQQQYNDLLSSFLVTEDTVFAHKTGGLEYVCNDAGIMYLEDPIFIAFLSKELKNNAYGARLAGEIGLLVYENYK